MRARIIPALSSASPCQGPRAGNFPRILTVSSRALPTLMSGHVGTSSARLHPQWGWRDEAPEYCFAPDDRGTGRLCSRGPDRLAVRGRQHLRGSVRPAPRRHRSVHGPQQCHKPPLALETVGRRRFVRSPLSTGRPTPHARPWSPASATRRRIAGPEQGRCPCLWRSTRREVLIPARSRSENPAKSPGIRHSPGPWCSPGDKLGPWRGQLPAGRPVIAETFTAAGEHTGQVPSSWTWCTSWTRWRGTQAAPGEAIGGEERESYRPAGQVGHREHRVERITHYHGPRDTHGGEPGRNCTATAGEDEGHGHEEGAVHSSSESRSSFACWM